MRSWFRAVGLHVVLLGTLVAAVLATHIAAVKPDLPLALLDSFDRTFDLVYEAAERKVNALEAVTPAVPARPDVVALLHQLEGHVAAACDAACVRLEVELLAAGALSPMRRTAVLGCIERHLGEARDAARRTTDPDERAEYDTTCERLREVRRLI